MPQTEKIAICKKWLGIKGLQFLETLIHTEQERCNTMEGIITALNKKFKPQYNETMKPLQFHMLVRQPNENAEEWTGTLRRATVECNYKEIGH